MRAARWLLAALCVPCVLLGLCAVPRAPSACRISHTLRADATRGLTMRGKTLRGGGGRENEDDSTDSNDSFQTRAEEALAGSSEQVNPQPPNLPPTPHGQHLEYEVLTR